MSVTLPDGPYREESRLDYISYGTDLRSSLGGSTQRINRLGDRFALTLVLPTMRTQACGGIWQTRISQAIRQGSIVKVPRQCNRMGVVTGTPLVNGAGQLGMSLNADGFDEGDTLLEGQLFSFVADGVNYLHRLTADVTVGAGGTASLSFEPMLRASPANNAVLEFAEPKIEGLIGREAGGLNATRWGHGQIDAITITEQR